ncbi:MAG: leucyl aminopeptidase, partial [Gammaproteobacteria bacterium]|nr:leucyl aminopeptidase [Gammaproteobacteria bacterium]
MKLYLDNDPSANIQSECLVIGVTEGGTLSPAAKGADEASGGTIGRMLKAGDIESTLGKVSFVHNVP